MSNIAARVAAEGLTMSMVTARTGLTAPTLRAWEERYGFPRPHRLSSRHRRYAEDEVGRIEQVLAERAAGRTLESAIARVLASPEAAADQHDASIFAGVRRRHPEVPAARLSRRAMLAVSHAIEDECLARAERPVLYVAFQRAAAYRRAERRWAALSATAEATVVFADFPRSRTMSGARATGPVHQVRLRADAPQRREWALVCDADDVAAVLAGWERPDGMFEAVWSTDPEVVATAADVARRLAAHHAPALPTQARQGGSANGRTALRTAHAVAARIVAYLDAPAAPSSA